MKRLIRILMVNWYRLEQQTIEINGHTAVIGPNASGKSSLLDAIQAVLVGGHKDWWKPNASAGEKSTRSLRDYCLGVVRDPDSSQVSEEFKPRDHAITHLVLVFEDDQSSERISVGLSIQSRLSESVERIDGRFIAPGIDMIMSDLTDQSEHGLMPKPWKQLKEELRSHAGSRLVLESQAEQFQRQICAELSDGKRHLDPKRFLRAFRNAITFAPIKNVSDFVRTFILEERDIQVKSLQQALQNYREIQRKTQEAEEKEKTLDSINSHYTKAENAERLTMSWRWVKHEALFNAVEAELEPLSAAIEKRKTKIDKLARSIQEMHDDWKQADEHLQSVNKQLAANDIEQQQATINSNIKIANLLKDQATKDINSSLRILGRLHALYDHKVLLKNTSIIEKLEELLPHLNFDGGELLSDWPLNPTDIESIVKQIQLLLEGEIAEQTKLRDTLISEQATARKELEELRERIARLESGQSDLLPTTQKLIDLLERRGIKAVPLCDRVEVADEKWRDSVESFLGGHREALLVEPSQVRDAITLYRKEGRRIGIFGSRIINTLKTQEWLIRKKENSLAEVIQSDDDHALAYINLRIGNVLKVESEDELVGNDRAITSDGMLVSGGSITRLKPVDPTLGREARKQNLALLKKRFFDGSENHEKVKKQKEQVSNLLDKQLQPVAQSLELPLDLVSNCNLRKEQDGRLASLSQDLKILLDDSIYQDLKEKVVKAERARESIDGQRSDASGQRSKLNLEQQADNDKYGRTEEESIKAVEDRRKIEQLQGFDAGQASDRLQELEERLFSDEESVCTWKKIAEEAERLGGRQISAVKNGRQNAYNELREYSSRWSNGQPKIIETANADRYIELASWTLSELNSLRETALSQFAKEAKTALSEAEVAFRADFIGKLQDNLQKLRGQLDELNRNLKQRPFHGQYYRFIKTEDKELEPILKLIETWSHEEAANVGSLFDTPNDPSHPHYEGIIKIRDLLMEASEDNSLFNKRLADYRQYFSFDVKMTDDVDGEKNTELLSRRIGKGSGGEHQSPFYVAIGASLAAAYRIERGEQGDYNGGLGLAVFDEAFSKLDLQNTVSALGFLNELGLQVLLAAPDEKYGQIAEHVDTIVNVYRDKGSVHIDTDHIKPQARKVLAADNPVIQPH